MEEFEEDDDVVLEGSAFHRVLQDAGYIDFEPILVNRHQTLDESQHSSKLFERLRNFLTRAVTLNIFDDTKVNYLSGKQIATILHAETLLVDHAEFVQNLLNKNSQSLWNKLGEWSTLIASAVILGTNYLIQERKRTLVNLLVSSVAAFAVHRKYDEFCAIGSLKNLVSLQNELHHLYKKGLRIMSKWYRVRTNSQQAPNRFSNLEIDRLKYIQPLTETLLKSLASVGRIYYQTSLMIVKILPKHNLDDLLMRFEDEIFNTDGEITYNRFKQLYYDYMMVQSNAMQLLAVAYDTDTWIEGGRIPHSQLSHIISKLYRLVKSHKMKLAQIIEDYESCKPKLIQRTFRGPRASKWKDLYLNLDLLSRKVATAYDAIGSILEEIDKHGDSSPNGDDDFIVEITPRINEIYKQIDSARNFAEFSDLLIVMLKRSGRREENLDFEQSAILPVITNDLPIVRDSDPQLVDEVFEEYITEEYLKPLYDQSDEIGWESAKLDKLLAKNFMSELKEALVDKYKSMAKREAKALLRKHQESNGDALGKSKNEESLIPCPPPLPSNASIDEEPRIIAAKREKRKFRSPVPLPRKSAKLQSLEILSSNPVSTQQLPLSVPPPPPLPPQIELSDENESLSIDLPMVGVRKIPAFMTFEEEFIGSGENSEEESALDSDSEKNVELTMR